MPLFFDIIISVRYGYEKDDKYAYLFPAGRMSGK